MAKFTNDILGMVSEADLLETGFMVERPNDPLEGLFADQATDNLVAEWYTVASEYQIPQMAQFHAFDVPAQKSERVPLDEHNVEKALIKVKRNTSELLHQLMRRGVSVEEQLYDFVMDDVDNLADQVVTRAKVARAELLATGKVTLKENGLNETIDYNVPSDHTSLTLDVGAGATTDVLTQIQGIIDKATEEGVTITGMVCSSAFLTKLRKNKDVQIAVNGTTAQGALIGRSRMQEFLNEEFGITQVITNDLTYAEPSIAKKNGRPVVKSHRYFPKDKVSFFGTYSGMKLGTGLWVTPPEVAISQVMQVQGSARSPYVYLSQWAEQDPSVLWTKASALYVPVLFAPQSLFIASVAETAE